MDERLQRCVSTGELERRWKAAREAMKERSIDCLIIRNSEIYQGGTVKWFTDLNARHQSPMTVIFPAEDDMTTIVCGTEPGNDNWPPDYAARGIKSRLGDVYFPTLSYTATYDGEIAVKVLKEMKPARIGIVEPAFMSVPFYKYLTDNMRDVEFTDATDWLDEIKAVKSSEEIGLIREAAALGDRLLEELKTIVVPGKRDIDVYADIHSFLAKNGSERAIVGVGSGAQTGPVAFIDDPHFQNRTINDGDAVSILLEFTGPGGYYVECHRPVAVGRISDELQETFSTAVEMQEKTAAMMTEGAQCSEIWREFKEMIVSRGYAPPIRSFAHAQGLSFLERPNIRPDETWKLKAGMNVAVHPGAVNSKAAAMIFDNYLIGKGKPERLQKYPKEIIVV